MTTKRLQYLQKSHAQAISKYMNNPVKCKYCHSTIIPKPDQKISQVRLLKFCDSSCAASYNNSKYPKRKVEGACRGCHKSCSTQNAFCSVACWKKYKLYCKAPFKAIKYARTQNHRYKTKKRAVDAMGGKCSVCSYSRCLKALQFHHKDPSKKKFAIGSNLRSWDKIQAELRKCVLLCANCHAELHA